MTPNAGDVLLGGESAGHGPALVWDETEITRRDLRQLVGALAVHLECGAGQRVAIVGPNVPATVVGMGAAWRAGAVAVPLSARLRRYELARILADAETRVVVSTLRYAGFAIAETIRDLAPSLPALRRQITLDDRGAVITKTDFRARADAEPLAEAAATVLYTSGSTGDPKGAVLSHAYSLQAADSFAEVLRDLAELPTGFVVPCSHMFGYAVLLTSLRVGGCAVLLNAARPTAALVAEIDHRQVEILHGSPTLFAGLIQTDRQLLIRAGFVAGARCPPELFDACEERGMTLLNQYGMTELGAVTACRIDDSLEVRRTTVGRALPSFEIKTTVGGSEDDPAEILVRGGHVWPARFQRPWGPERTSDGWLSTGDLGFLDASGNLTIAGRAKDVVNVGGFSVFPAEVEGFLVSHPGVDNAAVLGVSHLLLGEALVAFIVPKATEAPSPRELTGFCRAGIAGYKVPMSFTFVQELPVLSSGKLDRQALSRLNADART